MTGRELVHNRYEFLERVDSGANSAVFRCVDTFKSGRIIAMKRLPEEDANDRDSFKALQREFLYLKRLAGDMTVNVRDFINQGAVVGYTMDFIDGKSLKDQIRTSGVFSIEKAIMHLIQLAEAVESLHRTGYIHSALTVSNVLLESDSKVILSEFSFMFESGSDPESFPNGKRRQVVPPEYIDMRVLDERSDVYLIGVIAYEVLIGKEPFSGKSQFDRIVNHLEGRPVAPHRIREDVPLWLSDVVLTAMNRNPERRYQTAGELLKELLAHL